ncbi:MarR family transcriptional regulator [Rapidithrix thailandica]|uniref:MarR family transcriptional regulator n=1 Tax=Rapidithrix thailandica TaxID=413964 RepID=A0AAW9SAJ8_9BACT
MDSIEILIKIRKIVRSINLESKRIQKDFGISIPQLLCLGHLTQCENYQSTHSELMQLLSLNSSTVTGIINRLENRGLVARLPKMGDKRITYIALTSKGFKLLEDTPNILHDQLSAKIDKLPQGKKEMIKEALEIIIEALHIEEIDASPLLTIEEPIGKKEEQHEE